VEPLLPDRSQARRLVVSLAVFWGGFGVGLLGALYVPPLGAVVFVIAFGGVIAFYLTLYSVWESESGIPAWRMMFAPGFSRARRRSTRRVYDLLRPAWIKQTLRETGWPTRLVGAGLLALMIFALVTLLFIAPRVGRS
jgi:hypothetical protein